MCSFFTLLLLYSTNDRPLDDSQSKGRYWTILIPNSNVGNGGNPFYASFAGKFQVPIVLSQSPSAIKVKLRKFWAKIAALIGGWRGLSQSPSAIKVKLRKFEQKIAALIGGWRGLSQSPSAIKVKLRKFWTKNRSLDRWLKEFFAMYYSVLRHQYTTLVNIIRRSQEEGFIDFFSPHQLEWNVYCRCIFFHGKSAITRWGLVRVQLWEF